MLLMSRLAKLTLGLFLLLPLLTVSGGLAAQNRTQRLILKDGSYQSVVKYEVQGDRVHYLSAERYEWEDIPNSLIDWDATNKYAAELASGKHVTVTVETPEEREEREKEEANSPEVSPGLHLPGSGGVFLFDQFQGKPELAEIIQNGSELNEKDAKKSGLKAQINPLAGTHPIELKGAHAPMQSHQSRPVIYADIDEGPQSDMALNDRFRIVRTQVRNNARVIASLKMALSGKVTEQQTFVPAKVEKMSTGAWVRITPAADLAPGEYALVEMMDASEMNLYVWDFGVNPGAPANPNAIAPDTGAKPDTSN